MGDLLTSIVVNGKRREIPIIDRILSCDEHDQLRLEDVLNLDGGLIIGEGDSGKSVYAKQLYQQAQKTGPSVLIQLRGIGSKEALHNKILSAVNARIGKQVATVIIDGLDERPYLSVESGNPNALQETHSVISDIVNEIPVELCHFWVTSRPCTAANKINSPSHFQHICHLETLGHNDIRSLAHALGINFNLLMDAVHHIKGCRDFLRKPGGAILLFDQFERGLLSPGNRHSLMETIAMTFASQTRDGAPTDSRDNQDLMEVLEVASWMTTCLFLTGRNVITTDLCDRTTSLLLNDIPRRTYKLEHFTKALETRLFEPLNETSFRPAYAPMFAYLTSHWLCNHKDEIHLEKVIPRSQGPLDRLPAEVLMNVAERYPELVIPYVGNCASAFCACHDAISRFGVSGYFDALLKQGDRRSFDFSDYTFSLEGLKGNADFLQCAMEHLQAPTLTLRELIFFRRYVVETATPSSIISSPLVQIICNDKLDISLRYVAAKTLNAPRRHNIIDDVLLPPASVADMKRILKKKPTSLIEHDLLSCCLEWLWPNMLSVQELIEFLEGDVANSPNPYGVLGFLRYTFSIRSFTVECTPKLAASIHQRLFTWAIRQGERDFEPDRIVINAACMLAVRHIRTHSGTSLDDLHDKAESACRHITDHFSQTNTTEIHEILDKIRPSIPRLPSLEPGPGSLWYCTQCLKLGKELVLSDLSHLIDNPKWNSAEQISQVPTARCIELWLTLFKEGMNNRLPDILKRFFKDDLETSLIARMDGDPNLLAYAWPGIGLSEQIKTFRNQMIEAYENSHFHPHLTIDELQKFPHVAPPPSLPRDELVEIGAACRGFVRSCNRTKRIVTMERDFHIDNDIAWYIVEQLVTAAQYPVTIKNPQNYGKLDLRKRFQSKTNPDMPAFLAHIKVEHKGCKTQYTLTPEKQRAKRKDSR